MQGTVGTGSTALVVIALDCLGKLISYNYVTDDPKAMESVVDLICECFVGEGTDEKVQLQIVKVGKRYSAKLFTNVFGCSLLTLGSTGCSAIHYEPCSPIFLIESDKNYLQHILAVEKQRKSKHCSGDPDADGTKSIWPR
jgi:hypothetical protein